MPMFISGSGGACSGSLWGVLSGTLPIAATGSYSNADAALGYPVVCTGSLLVSNYVSGSDTSQRVHAYLGGPDGATWTLLGGQPGAYAEGPGTVTQYVGSSIYKPGSVIYVDPSTAWRHLAYTLEPAATAGAGSEYTFIATANAGSGATFGITGSSGELQVMFQCGNGTFMETGKTWFTFNPGIMTQGSRIICRCDGNSWYLDGSTDKDNNEISVNS